MVAGRFWCSYAWVSLTQTAPARPRAACAPVCTPVCTPVCARVQACARVHVLCRRPVGGVAWCGGVVVWRPVCCAVQRRWYGVVCAVPLIPFSLCLSRRCAVVLWCAAGWCAGVCTGVVSYLFSAGGGAGACLFLSSGGGAVVVCIRICILAFRLS